MLWWSNPTTIGWIFHKHICCPNEIFGYQSSGPFYRRLVINYPISPPKFGWWSRRRHIFHRKKRAELINWQHSLWGRGSIGDLLYLNRGIEWSLADAAGKRSVQQEYVVKEIPIMKAWRDGGVPWVREVRHWSRNGFMIESCRDNSILIVRKVVDLARHRNSFTTTPQLIYLDTATHFSLFC